MGGNSTNTYASLTLEAATAAYDRLCDVEEKFGVVWAEKRRNRWYNCYFTSSN